MTLDFVSLKERVAFRHKTTMIYEHAVKIGLLDHKKQITNHD